MPPSLTEVRLSYKGIVMVCFCFTASVVCYVDRTNISVAIVAMARDYEWGDAQRSLVLSSFFIGYMTTQVLGGVLSRRYGGGAVLCSGVIAWSLFTLLTPIAAATGFGTLLACRILMGVGEGVAMPSIHQLLGAWVPPQWRTIATAFSTTGQAVGTILAMAASPLAARSWGAVFVVFGVLGLVWAVVFALLAPTRPRSGAVNAPTPMQIVSAGAVATFASGEDSGDGAEGAAGGGARAGDVCSGADVGDGSAAVTKRAAQPLSAAQQWRIAGRMLRHPPVWGIMVAHVAHNYGYYVLLSWLPAYFVHLGVPLDQVGAFAVGPYAAMALFDTAWAAGECYFMYRYILRESCSQFDSLPLTYLSVVSFAAMDALVARDLASRLFVRKLSQSVAFLVPAALLALISLGAAPRPALAAVLLSIALGLNTASHSGYWASIIDVAPRNAGLLCGISNTVATVPGIVGNLVTGAILQLAAGPSPGDGDGWPAVFLVAVANYVIGLVGFLCFASATAVDFEDDSLWRGGARPGAPSWRCCACGGRARARGRERTRARTRARARGGA